MKYFNTRNELLTILEKNIKVCEIGVFKGDFSEVLLESLNPSELHLIDIFDGQMCSGDKDGNNIIWTNLNDEYEFICRKYKHFENSDSDVTWVSWEYPDEYNKDKEPYYPVNDKINNEIYQKYKKLPEEYSNIYFGGRLAEYKYYDMHKVIEGSLTFIKSIC